MKRVLVLQVGEFVEGVFADDKELIKEFFLKSYELNDINVDELFETEKTLYQFGEFTGLETIRLTRHVMMENGSYFY